MAARHPNPRFDARVIIYVRVPCKTVPGLRERTGNIALLAIVEKLILSNRPNFQANFVRMKWTPFSCSLPRRLGESKNVVIPSEPAPAYATAHDFARARDLLLVLYLYLAALSNFRLTLVKSALPKQRSLSCLE